MSRAAVYATAALLLLFLFQPSSAEWSRDVHNGITLTEDDGLQMIPKVVDDGYGGFITVWLDFRSGTPAIFAQRIDVGGNIVWQPEDGLEVYQMEYDYYNDLEVVADGVGGALIIFTMKPNDLEVEIFATHIDVEGGAWSAPVNLVPSEAGLSNRWDVSAVSDGNGGVIVAFMDDRLAFHCIHAQRISGSGALLWGDTGIDVYPWAYTSSDPVVVSDGSQGAYVIWEDQQITAGEWDIRAQRLTSTGTFAWNSRGVEICAASGNQVRIDGAPDGSGGVLVCWQDHRNVDSDVYVQRVGPSGAPWWTGYGLLACSDVGEQELPRVLSDGYGGAYISWTDYRLDSWDLTDVYAQHITTSGSRLWGASGLVASAMDGFHGFFGHDMVSDGQGGIILTWTGFETSEASYSDIFGQRIDANGLRMWNSYGCRPVFLGSGDQYGLHSVANPYTGGVVTTFLDKPDHVDFEVTVMSTDHHGYPGDARPFITELTDFPQDQGGVLIVSWERSYLDEPVNNGIGDYTLWRRLVSPDAMSIPVQGAKSTAATSGLCESKVAALLSAGWSYLATMDAATHDTYAYDAPSYGDSTDTETVWSEYMVIARQTDLIFWESPPHAGFSVDNLAPGAPTGLAAAAEGADVTLNWSPSGHHDEDLSHYVIYRGDTPGFAAGPATFLAAVDDTAYADLAPGVDLWYYRITARDVHGNEGLESNEAQAEILVGVDDRVPARFALLGNRPNPFNPATSIAFDLAEAGSVTLVVYDAAGRHVATLLDGTRSAGRHELTWRGVDDAGLPVTSGVYLARLVFGKESAVRRMVLLR